MSDLGHAETRAGFQAQYRTALLEDIIPFWLRHGWDRDHGGLLSCLDRDGTVIDTDKSIWAQGRTAWMMATLFNTMEPREEWLELSRSCVDFLRNHAYAEDGKMFFTVTRDGQPLRMRRYAYSEAFAAMGYAAFAKAADDDQARTDAVRMFENFVRYSNHPKLTEPKVNPDVRPMKSIGPSMIGIGVAQELRANLGDIEIGDRSCSDWIDTFIEDIQNNFVKPEEEAVLEVVHADGSILDHFDGRTLNPGHAMEGAWFILREAWERQDAQRTELGTAMLDWMWARGWDTEHGGIFYFRDLKGLPVQEYWHDMKFWWPHNEAMLATWMAWSLTGDTKYALMHRDVHDWSFKHFPDPEHGEWFGYLHREGRVSVGAKGNLWKSCFHLPRMLWWLTRMDTES